MKKKAIEKIPYFGLKKTSRKKSVKYIGVTAVKIIGHEKHLFLEVYKNEKQAAAVPVVRIVLTQKDFGTYIPDKEKWTREKTLESGYCGRLIWETPEERRRYNEGNVDIKKRNILQDSEDLKRIKNFTKKEVWDEARWWEFIDRHQDSIVTNERNKIWFRKIKRRQDALNERNINTPELPKKKLLEQADNIFFKKEHYLFYKKRGVRAEICCSACGGVKEVRWKQGMSYESQFETFANPIEGNYGTCPMCRAAGIWKCQGKARHSSEKKVYVYLGNKYKETGFVMRYLEISKEWVLEEIDILKKQRMTGAYEKMSGVEIARVYFEPDGKVQKDFHKHSPYSGHDFWDDCNLTGLANIVLNANRVFPQTYEEIKGTMFQYSALEKYVEAFDDVDAVDYLERYMQYPQLEMLVKQGLIWTARTIVRGNYGIIQGEYATSLNDFLGIRKDKIKYLISRQGRIEVVWLLNAERKINQNWTVEQIEKLEELVMTENDVYRIRMALSITTVQKFINRIEKYAGCQFGGCSQNMERLRNTARLYTDYLEMRRELGYDLTNTVYQQPRNLEAAHNKMVKESNAKEQDRRIREVEMLYPLIRENYKKIRKKYFYEDENYVIRPAMSAAEIVLEGRILHHCVGGNNYLRNHNDEKSIILFLRFKSEQETPYITVEIIGNRILQWYGANDKKPDKDNITRWLNAYTTRLLCQEKNKEGESAARQRMLAYA